MGNKHCFDSLAISAGKLSARTIKFFGAGLGSNLPGRVRVCFRRVFSPDLPVNADAESLQFPAPM